MSNESSKTSDILTELRQKHDCFAVKIAGGQYQMAGLPDVLILKDGVYLWIEFKVEDKPVRPQQAAVHRKLKQHGARCHVVRFMEPKYWMVDDFFHIRFKLFRDGVGALLNLLLELEKGGEVESTLNPTTT